MKQPDQSLTGFPRTIVSGRELTRRIVGRSDSFFSRCRLHACPDTALNRENEYEKTRRSALERRGSMSGV